jgi:hypothetical protein
MHFRDWLFGLFVADKTKWAQTRVRELMTERQDLYDKLMREVNMIERAVDDRNNNNGHW